MSCMVSMLSDASVIKISLIGVIGEEGKIASRLKKIMIVIDKIVINYTILL